MGKLESEIIKKINSYPATESDRKIGDELGINRKTVAKYRKDILETISKGDKKKLELLEHYSDSEIQEMLNYIATNTKKEIDKVIGEP